MCERPWTKLRANDCRLRRRPLLALAACRAALAASGVAAASAPQPTAPAGSAVWLEQQLRNARPDTDLALFRLKVEASLAPEVDVHAAWPY